MSSTRNKLDATASTRTQQAVQGSIQAQDTSPSALPTTLAQDEQNTIVLQPKSKQQRGKPINSLLINTAIVLMAVGAIVWVLNITDTIKGPWSSVCASLFTSVGTIITLLQLYSQFAAVPTPVVTTTPLSTDAQSPDPLSGDFSIPSPSGQEGALVVYTKRSLRGFSIALCQGFWEDANPYAAQNIVERKIKGDTYYIAVFESLTPGPHTAHIYRREMTAKVTIYPGKVTPIDWR